MAGSVQLIGLGKLKTGERPERQGRNPATDEAMTIKASKTVKFAAAKKLKTASPKSCKSAADALSVVNQRH